MPALPRAAAFSVSLLCFRMLAEGGELALDRGCVNSLPAPQAGA